jgi:hypothetical protein
MPPAIKVARTATDWAALGLEYYSDLGPSSQMRFGANGMSLASRIGTTCASGILKFPHRFVPTPPHFGHIMPGCAVHADRASGRPDTG